MHYNYPQPGGGYAGSQPPHFYPQQRQQQPPAYPNGASLPPAPMPGTPGAYFAAHHQQQNHHQYRQAHPMVVIPPRPPSNVHPHAQPPVPQNTYHQFGGVPMPAQYASPQPPPQRAPSRPYYPQSSSPPRSQTSSAPTPRPHQAVSVQIPSPRPPPQTDYAELLLSLADEFIRAAHKIGPVVPLSKREKDEGRYYALMTRGLACLEILLKRFRFAPRMEGKLILKFASLLHEETDNDDTVQELLSRGITLCERNRMLDMKYSMQHLLARSLFKTNHVAAMKSIDTVLQTAEMYQHKVWVYAFRFLRASLCMKTGVRGDLLAAQNSLRSVSTLAVSQGDRAIYVTALAMEATVHLRIMAPDSVEQAQRAIASARSQQFLSTEQDLGFMVPYLDLMDLLCHLQTSKASAAGARMTSLQAILDNLIQRKDLEESESFSVLINQGSAGPLTAMTGGIFQRGDGRDRLTVSWMRRRDLCALGYYLSAATFQLHSPTADRLQRFLGEGLRMSQGMTTAHETISSLTQEAEHLRIPDTSLASRPSAAERIAWHRILSWYMRAQQAFVACNKCEWQNARNIFQALQKEVRQAPKSAQKPMSRFSTYLAGMISQATGDLTTALSAYRTLYSNAPIEYSSQTDISTLSAMNALLILRTPTHPAHADAFTLLRTIEARAEAHPSDSLRAAVYLLKAITQPGRLDNNAAPSVVSMKQNLQHALQASKAGGNDQLLAICITVLAATFFKDIVSTQADKGAKNSRQLAVRAGNPLWVVVASGLVANTAEMKGDGETAAAARADAESRLATLPRAVRESFVVGLAS